MRKFLSFMIVAVSLSACTHQNWPEPKSDGPAMPAVAVSPVKREVSQAQVDQMTGYCYDQLQKSIGETRPRRGVIWAKCKQQYVMPLEQQLYPRKKGQIDKMYAALIADMNAWYEGRTTWELLDARWQQRQKAIGFRYTETFHDNMVPF